MKMSSIDILCNNVLHTLPEMSTYEVILQDDPNYKEYTHCSHVMIYAKTNTMSFGKYNRKAIILMQMRFDGSIGFPGGGVDEGETFVEAVNREIKEESGWSENDGPVTESDHVYSVVHLNKKKVLHFYAVEVSESKISDIEINALKAPDYGAEVLGNFRVPLYTMTDSFKGFPAFLKNRFAGPAKLQLLVSLLKLNILTSDNVLQALQSEPTHNNNSTTKSFA